MSKKVATTFAAIAITAGAIASFDLLYPQQVHGFALNPVCNTPAIPPPSWSAPEVTMSIGGVDYNLSYVCLRPPESPTAPQITLFSQQIWWNNESLAQGLAMALGFQFDAVNLLPNLLSSSTIPVPSGPLFAVATPPQVGYFPRYYAYTIRSSFLSFPEYYPHHSLHPDRVYAFAVARPVAEAIPEPSTLLGLLLAAGGGAVLRCRQLKRNSRRSS